MPKQPTDELYRIQPANLEDVKLLRPEAQISPSIKRYVTDDETKVLDIAQDAHRHGQRMEIWGRNPSLNGWIPLGMNPGHSPGIDPSYILDYNGTVTEALQNLSQVGKDIDLDYFKINVVSNWRKG